MLGAALELFTRAGLWGLSRWAHIFSGITWIGLLYYFNFVQVPSFAEMDAAARNNAIDKLASRALWWFRWGAVATLAFGLLLLALQTPVKANGDYFTSAQGLSILTGILLAVTMFLNVWLVIWPAQKVVIANARNVQAGGEADPAAAAAGRRAALASRMNTIFSIPMLLFMVGTAHFFVYSHFRQNPSNTRQLVYWIVAVAIWLVLEADALGLIAGVKQGWTKWIYETHQRAIWAAFGLTVVYYALWEVLLRARNT